MHAELHKHMADKNNPGEYEQRIEWIPPPADQCEEFSYDSPVGDLGDILRFRQCWDLNGRMVDFAIIQMTRLDGYLVRVAAADIRHGELHVHVMNKAGKRIARESIQPVISHQDAEKAYDAALDLFTEKWEEYKRRWRHG